MADTDLSLAAAFDPPDEARWRALAEKALKGAAFDRLTTRAPGGLEIKPLYREPDAPGAGDPLAAPGQAPFARGRLGARDAFAPWDIRQVCAHGDSETANAWILEDLKGGVTAVEILVDDGCGAGLSDVAAIPAALTGVLLDAAPVAVDGGWLGAAAAAALADALKASGCAPDGLGPAFNLDPLGAWMRHGAAPRDIAVEVAEAASQATALMRAFPNGAAIAVSGLDAAEAGGSPAQELGVMLAAGAAYLRAFEALGVAPPAAAAGFLMRLSTGPDVIVEIAKLRAARLVWAHLMAACGAPPTARAIRQQAISAHWMLTRDDAWTNILRGTAACFAAAAGGADHITTRPFTEPLGAPSALARRMARNIQLILMEESRLGHVIDPGGGAWAVEALTRDLAEAGWAAFQAIEREGGLAAALSKGWLQKEIAAVREARAKDVARRKQPITGVSDFPLLDETTPEVAPGGDRAAATPTLGAARIEALSWMRQSEPFERLRDRAKPHAPKVFFANLGPLAEFSARGNFAANLFAAGGVAPHAQETVYPDHAAVAQAFKDSLLSVAVVTGTDARYAAEAADAARALKAAGCAWLIYAGKPQDEEAARAAGFDQFIWAGQDALAALDTLHRALGIAS